MTKMVPKVALFSLVLLGAVSLSLATVRAEHDNFRFKWPYLPGASFVVTGYPYTDHHGCDGGSCTDAWDIVISGDDVRSSAEGTAYEVVSYLAPGTCGPTLGLGNNVKVSVPYGPSVYYAHLSSSPVVEGSRILQGDDIGVQGDTGNTTDGMGGCGWHLHFEFVPAHPDRIDDTTNPSESTNSPVGAYNFPGGAIRQRYIDLGDPYASWASVGWTADWTGNQTGCIEQPFCRLQVHYHPDPEEGHWGSVQTFRKHPDSYGSQYAGVQVGRWAVNDAYWVEQPFHDYWLYTSPGIGLPLMDRIGTNPDGLCLEATGCVRYQRFHVGYIWEHETQGVQAPVFCPDIAPYYPEQDYVIDLFNDIVTTITKFQASDDWAPFEAWPDAWYDINGDGIVDLVNDIVAVIQNFGISCYP